MAENGLSLCSVFTADLKTAAPQRIPEDKTDVFSSAVIVLLNEASAAGGDKCVVNIPNGVIDISGI